MVARFVRDIERSTVAEKIAPYAKDHRMREGMTGASADR
jgi:hypothetical protein